MSTAAPTTGGPATAMTAASSQKKSGSNSGVIRSQYAKIVSWEDPYYSGAVTAGFNALCLAFWAMRINILSSFILFALLGILFAFPLTQFFGYALPSNKDLVSKDQLQNLLDFTYSHLNHLGMEIMKILNWGDRKISIMAVAFLFTSFVISQMVSVYTMTYLAVNYLLLAKPSTVLYRKHLEKQVHPYTLKVQQKVHEAVAKIPALNEIAARIRAANKTHTKKAI